MEAFQRFSDLFFMRQDLLWSSLWQHMQLSLLSLLCAVFIAVPLGILLSRYPRYAEWVIGVTAVLQTIPSLALLGFMILLVGIGPTPAIIALTIYALLPILRNTYTGINEVDPAIREAATGMGMNWQHRLLKVELPLAMPTVMAGIRTSMVLIVGTATLAALIGAGGLGDLIMIGIQRANNEYILLGAIPAALLALGFDLVLRVTEKQTKGASYKPIIGLITCAVALIVVPLLFTEESGTDIVIGGKLQAEPAIVANMYKLLIEEETDLNVDVQSGLGGTDIVFNALKVGDIDLYLEFSGTILSGILQREEFSYDPRTAYEEARDEMYEAEGLVFLEPMAYQNTYAIAVTKEFAKETGVQTISELESYRDQLVAGFTFEFIDRQDGYAGFSEVYGFEFADVQTMDAALRARALVSGEVQLIDAYSTDPELVEYELHVLEDDRQLFPPYQGGALVREDTLLRYPEIEAPLERLAGTVTEEEIRQLNYLVDYEDADPEAVARDFLQEKGYIK